MLDLANMSVADQRAAWRATRTRVLQRRDHDMPGLQAEIDRTSRELDSARAAFARAEAACAAAQLAKLDRSVALDRELFNAEDGLRRTADPAIAAFIQQELPALERTTRDALIVVEGYIDQRSTAWTPGSSTQPSIERRLAASRQARREAEALQFELLTADAVQAQLERLRVSITSIEIAFQEGA